jgi:outer membrane protein TolC
MALIDSRRGKARHILRHAPWPLALLAMAGCAVGPRFKTPEPPKVDRYGPAPLPPKVGAAGVPGGGVQRFQPGQAVPDQWWRAFGSEELDQRIASALAHNPTVEAARASLRQAQATL